MSQESQTKTAKTFFQFYKDKILNEDEDILEILNKKANGLESEGIHHFLMLNYLSIVRNIRNFERIFL